MRLYKQESPEIVFQMQNQDPFFDYLTRKTMLILDTLPTGTLFDLGCGSGRICIEAAKRGWKTVGVDENKLAIQNAQYAAKREHVQDRCTFILSSIEKLKQKKIGQCDVCTMQEVIEHVPDYQALVDAAYDLLVPGGMLLLTTPYDPAQWTLLDDYAEHVRRFTKEQIVASFSAYTDVKVYTISFPIRRFIIFLYDALMRICKKDHEAKYFRQSSFIRRFYYILGSLAVWVDDWFNGTPWGTTIWAQAKKPLKHRSARPRHAS